MSECEQCKQLRAEVERLKREGLDALNEWAHEEKRLQVEIERLKAQCLLAGVQGAKDGDEIAEIYKAERDTLQAMWNTLADAAKGVLHADRLHDKVPLEKLVNLEHAVYSEHPDTIAPARAELSRLKHPTVTVSWKDGQETLPLDKVVFHIERLQAVKEAAEAFLNEMESRSYEGLSAHEPLRDTLRRALDACAQDPAR